MAKKTEATTAMVKEEPKVLAVATDYSQYGGEGAGYENQSSEDTSIPFINILQPGSPVVAQATIEGATAGKFLNTVTNQIWDNKNDNLIIIPVLTKHEFIEWVPRKAGGGFVSKYEIDDPIVKQAKSEGKFGKYHMKLEGSPRFDGDVGNDLQETFTVFALQCGESPDDPFGMAIVPFKSSAIKCYKAWMSSIRAYQQIVDGRRQTPPLFSHLSRFTSEMKQGEGNTWFVPKYEAAINKSRAESCLGTDDPRFLAAFEMYQFVNSGKAKVDYSKQNNDAGEPGEVDGIPVDASGKKLF